MQLLECLLSTRTHNSIQLRDELWTFPNICLKRLREITRCEYRADTYRSQKEEERVLLRGSTHLDALQVRPGGTWITQTKGLIAEIQMRNFCSFSRTLLSWILFSRCRTKSKSRRQQDRTKMETTEGKWISANLTNFAGNESQIQRETKKSK